MEVGLKLAEAPDGSPEAERETAELKPPETEVETVVVAEPPCTAETEPGEAEIEKSGVLVGLKTMLRTAWSSIPLGATPVWPWRKSNMPTPLICTGMLAVWKLVVTLNLASNAARAWETPVAKGLPPPTQLGAGISAIMVRPEASWRMRW
jgi:hypothetical protein